ncbi:MAG: hypothetical protein JO311_03920 [Candidatus Eremiobacteraeota bacterium]|nr:hypothetical protein [Candidatus Eremiobacteraeota bacterium]
MQRTALPAALTTLAFLLACRAANAAVPSPASTSSPPPPALIYLNATRVDFYYDRFLLEADGNVRLRTSDGFTVTGDSFSMDLKLNRFLVAGHVTLHDSSGTVSGAAISDFLDFRRIYFVPVTSEPDRCMFLDGDLAHPAKGRVMPGDAFYFPDVPQQPSITGTGAVIGTKTYVRFINSHTYLAGAPIPLGSYVVNFSPEQYFAQNSLSGATADLTWNLAGSDNSLTALHLRYDPTYHTYLSVEQHLVGQHEYAIFSVNPATRAEKWWNLMLYEKLGSRFQISSFTQYYTQQNWLSLPRAAQQTTYLTATYAMPHSYLQATSQLTNYNVLGPGALELPHSIAGSLDHPTQVQLTASSFQNRVGKLPLYEQIWEGYGFAHDSVGAQQYLNGFSPYWPQGGVRFAPIPIPGLQAYGSPCPYQPVPKSFTYYCPVYRTIWNTVLGFSFFTPALKLNNPPSPYQTYYFNASFSKQYQWNSLPHWIDNTSENFTISRQFSRAVNTYLGYQILNVGDHYIHGGYLPCTPVNSFYCPLSFTSFRGVSTLRTTSLGMNFTPTPEFNFSLLVRHHDDFPIPVPGVFGLPPNNILGQPLYSWFLGQPPYDASFDVRLKILPHALLDVSKSLYWYGNPYRTQFWQPATVVQILPI